MRVVGLSIRCCRFYRWRSFPFWKVNIYCSVVFFDLYSIDRFNSQNKMAQKHRCAVLRYAHVLRSFFLTIYAGSAVITTGTMN